MKKLIPALLVALTLVGCGGSDGVDTSEQEEQIRDLTARAADLRLNKKYEAYCRLLSSAGISQIESSENLGKTDCKSAMAFAGTLTSEEDLKKIREPESITVEGDKATVRFEKEQSDSDFEAVKIGGRWQIEAIGIEPEEPHEE